MDFEARFASCWWAHLKLGEELGAISRLLLIGDSDSQPWVGAVLENDPGGLRRWYRHRAARRRQQDLDGDVGHVWKLILSRQILKRTQSKLCYSRRLTLRPSYSDCRTPGKAMSWTRLDGMDLGALVRTWWWSGSRWRSAPSMVAVIPLPTSRLEMRLLKTANWVALLEEQCWQLPARLVGQELSCFPVSFWQVIREVFNRLEKGFIAISIRFIHSLP